MIIHNIYYIYKIWVLTKLLWKDEKYRFGDGDDDDDDNYNNNDGLL